VLAQLVAGLLTDAPQGVAEMRRVARRGAPVATCVWDFGSGSHPKGPFRLTARAGTPLALLRAATSY
jgi:hypothetical protein